MHGFETRTRTNQKQYTGTSSRQRKATENLYALDFPLGRPRNYHGGMECSRELQLLIQVSHYLPLTTTLRHIENSLYDADQNEIESEEDGAIFRIPPLCEDQVHYKTRRSAKRQRDIIFQLPPDNSSEESTVRWIPNSLKSLNNVTRLSSSPPFDTQLATNVTLPLSGRFHFSLL